MSNPQNNNNIVVERDYTVECYASEQAFRNAYQDQISLQSCETYRGSDVPEEVLHLPVVKGLIGPMIDPVRGDFTYKTPLKFRKDSLQPNQTSI
jgi:hypothetical protein